ncbi:MAG: MEDS domain-containing protein [Thermodesulfobacteriota bacterium]
MGQLTIQEVAGLLKAHPNTVYKMCRQGVLPAVKIGKEWRIDGHKLARFLEQGVPRSLRPAPRDAMPQVLSGGHVLGLFSDQGDIWAFEEEFFKASLAQGYKLFKACWWQDPGEVSSRLAASGLPVSDLEAKGDLIIADLNPPFHRHGPLGAAGVWYKATTEALAQGYAGLVGSGSPSLTCCGGPEELIEFEKSLDQLLSGLPVTGVCCYALPQDISRHLDLILNIMEAHDRFFFRTPGKELMARPVTAKPVQAD